MYITKINYEQVIQRKQYEPLRIGVEVTINQGEDAAQALRTAREFVTNALKETTEALNNPDPKAIKPTFMPTARPLP